MTKAEYLKMAGNMQEHIRAGDIFQVVPSQRFTVPFHGRPIDLYRALRSINPSPYMFCLEMAGLALVGSSPETHVRCENGKVEIRPIAGTKPRGATTEEDLQNEKEMRADPKERAEHIMLVDLARNDLGRVCEYHSVKVVELMEVERFSHVMHLVSRVTGQLRAGQDSFQVMRATFPAGTVSGSPKVRALENKGTSWSITTLPVVAEFSVVSACAAVRPSIPPIPRAMVLNTFLLFAFIIYLVDSIFKIFIPCVAKRQLHWMKPDLPDFRNCFGCR
jgi:hypothetical protein